MPVDFEYWQKRWDAQQTAYIPDREQRFEAMLDVVEATRGDAPAILDLAGGTGSITRRALERFPRATSVIIDADPALLAIAEGSFRPDGRVRIWRGNLSTAAWIADIDRVSDTGFDAVLTATALHWLEPDRVATLYREVRSLLHAGGVFANADHMPDEGLEVIADGLTVIRTARTQSWREANDASNWNGWWQELAAEPELASLVVERDELYRDRAQGHTRSFMPSSWHLQALVDAGFGHAGLAWRGLDDALAVGIAR